MCYLNSFKHATHLRFWSHDDVQIRICNQNGCGVHRPSLAAARLHTLSHTAFAALTAVVVDHARQTINGGAAARFNNR